MTLDNLLLGPGPATYNLGLDPIYGPLFDAQAGQPQQQRGQMPGMPSGPGGDLQALARALAARRGWTGPQFGALNKIISAESGWNPRAVNPSSGAAGLPQMLPSAHPDVNVQSFLSNPRAQLAWMMRYIAGRYGDPMNAWQTRQSQGWY